LLDWQRSSIMTRMLTVEQARELITMVANGRTLKSACKEKGFNTAAFYARRAVDVAITGEYARAREMFDETLEDDALEIADDPYLEPHEKRIRIETRHKHLAANRQAKWGNKVHLDVNVKGDPREAERKADERLLRLSSDPAVPLLTQVIDAEVISVRTTADKQSAGDILDAEPGIFDQS